MLIIDLGQIEGVVGLIRKLLLKKLLMRATTLFTEWLDTGPVVLLRKGFGSISRLVKIITYSLSF